MGEGELVTPIEIIHHWLSSSKAEERAYDVHYYDSSAGAYRFEIQLSSETLLVFAYFGDTISECVEKAAEWAKEHPDA
jgi:hypothetical protein